MNKFIFICFLLFISIDISAQDWKQMMDDPTFNIYEVVDAAESYFEYVDKTKKGSGWKKYQRWLLTLALRVT